jgi:hypothetical protein
MRTIRVTIQAGKNDPQKRCCGSGSGIRDPGLGAFLTLDPGWEKVSIRIRDPGLTTRIIFLRA